MYRPLPIMFIASVLAATAAWAEPQGHDSRYPQQGGGGRYERGAGEASHQQGRPMDQARPMQQPRPMQQSQPMERGDRGGGGDRGGAYRGAADRGVGGFRGADTYRGGDRGPIGQVYTQRNPPAPQSREPARDGGSRYDRGAIGNVANARPGNDRRDYNRPGNDRRDYGRPGNDRPGFASGRDRYDRDRHDGDRYHDQGRDHSRYAGWTRGRDDWRDGGGRSWHHDGDWYQRYHYDHFRWYDNRFYARQRFSIGFYYAPWGYAPRAWVYGDRLPLSYYGNRYLVDDYYNYDLYAPPYGTSWVRVGDDVLLVDLDTGEVLDSIANLFW